MTNIIGPLEWFRDSKGDLRAPVPNGQLIIRYTDYNPNPGSSDPYWVLMLETFTQVLGNHNSLQDVLKAADEWVGDS